MSDVDVVKLVDTPDLGSGAARRGGSSPSIRTILQSEFRPVRIRRLSFDVVLFVENRRIWSPGFDHQASGLVGRR